MIITQFSLGYYIISFQELENMLTLEQFATMTSLLIIYVKFCQQKWSVT